MVVPEIEKCPRLGGTTFTNTPFCGILCFMSAFSEEYKVNAFECMEPDVSIEGRFAVPECANIWCFVDAIDALGKKATGGIIGVVPLESNYSQYKNPYSELRILEKLVEKANFRAILTFGQMSVLADGTSGMLTHFDIIMHEYDLPVCFAKRPKALRGEAHENEWSNENGLRALHGKKGNLTLSTDAKRVTLATQK